MKPSDLITAFQEACIMETSFYPELWTESNPTLGNSQVVALMVNWLFGGDIIKCRVKAKHFERLHYYNLIDGETVDFTRQQYVGEGISCLSNSRIVDWQELTTVHAKQFDIYRKNFLKVCAKYGISNLIKNKAIK